MISYKYKLYNSKKNKKLDEQLRACCFVWNRALAIQKRFYKLYGTYISLYKMQAHFAKRYNNKIDFLKQVGSQTTQEILERLDKSYKRFFKKIQTRPPKFKKVGSFNSFIFKGTIGYKLKENEIHVNKLKTTFKFSLSREYGTPRQVIFKKTPDGCFYLIIISSEFKGNIHKKTHNGASVGFDFGLKDFLVSDGGKVIKSPEFLSKELKTLRIKSKNLSHKKRGSGNRKQARLELSRLHRDISNKRLDWFYKTAHDICRNYEYIYMETLNIKAMQQLWGRKISDLSHAKFCEILGHVASKYDVKVHFIDRWFPSSKLCSSCGEKNNDLKLKDRLWICPNCGKSHNRDINAAINIKRQGIDEHRSIIKSTACCG